jgi:signal transduction histidine kinase
MTIIPRTLAGRTIAVLLAGLVVSNLVGLVIFSGERDTALNRAAYQSAGERIAAVVQSLKRTPSAARAGPVCSQSGPRFAASLASQPAVASDEGGSRSRLMRSVIGGILGNPATEHLRVAGEGFDGDTPSRQIFADVMQQCMGSMMQNMGPMMQNMGGMMGGQGMRGMTMVAPGDPAIAVWPQSDIIRISYRINDGLWLNAVAFAPQAGSIWRSRYFVVFFVMALVVTALSVWAVWRSTAPLALFAWAAERLGQDMNAPDLPEEGPREVHLAARSFNEMKRRLRNLINDRTQMLAAISHDLRTPITRLRLRAEFVDDDEQRAKMLSDLEQMEAMIAATLSFAREDSTAEPRKNLDLAALVQSVCDDATDMGSDVVCDGAARASYNGRPMALKRAFTNLVDNAVKYGGSARVALEETREGIVVTVDDNGPGVPDSEIERIFKPFYRAETSRNRETGGTGLGLAVVRSIIRGHGGEVTLANRAEGGLRATVALPRT